MKFQKDTTKYSLYLLVLIEENLDVVMGPRRRNQRRYTEKSVAHPFRVSCVVQITRVICGEVLRHLIIRSKGLLGQSGKGLTRWKIYPGNDFKRQHAFQKTYALKIDYIFRF